MKHPWLLTTTCIGGFCNAQQMQVTPAWDCTTAPDAVLDPMCVAEASIPKKPNNLTETQALYTKGLCSVTDVLDEEINALKGALWVHYIRNSPSDPSHTYQQLCRAYEEKLKILRARGANGLPAENLHPTELEYALIRIGHPSTDSKGPITEAEAAARAILQDTEHAYRAGMADAAQRYKAQITVKLVELLKQRCEKKPWDQATVAETQQLYDSLQQLSIAGLKAGTGTVQDAISATMSCGKFRTTTAKHKKAQKEAQQKLVEDGTALLRILQDRENKGLIPHTQVEALQKLLKTEQEQLELMRK